MFNPRNARARDARDKKYNLILQLCTSHFSSFITCIGVTVMELHLIHQTQSGVIHLK